MGTATQYAACRELVRHGATDFPVSLDDAQVVIGTSAGSIGAALVGLGFEGGDVGVPWPQAHNHAPSLDG